jgi:hypothetical protein
MARDKTSRRKDRLSQHNADLDVHEKEVPSLRRAAARWQTAEPWRVRERRNRWRRIAIISLLAVVVIVVLTVTGPKSAGLTHAAVVGVAESSGTIRLLFYGCDGVQLMRVQMFEGQADTTQKSTGEGALWYVSATTSQGASGAVNVPLGVPPAHMSNEISLNGLAAVPADTLIWVYALTKTQLVQFDFDKAFLSSGKVFTAAGTFTLAQYNTEGEQLCGTSK